MKTVWISGAIIMTVGLIPFLLGSSCAQTGVPAGGGTAADLTDAQKQALVAGTKAAESVGQGSQMSGYASQTADGSSKSINALTIGNCPAVTVSGGITGQLGALAGEGTLGIDFGQDPCNVPFSYLVTGTSYACSGSASGTLNLTAQSLNLIFNQLSCNGEAIDGTMNVSINRGTAFAVDGDWDLTYTSAEDSYACTTTGNGAGSYAWVDGCCDVTTISTFTGTVGETVGGETYQWSVGMESIQISLEQTGMLMPYSGSITLTGPDIGTVTVVFNENSPVTGEVTVTIPNPYGSGTLSFTVELYTLADWLAATP